MRSENESENEPLFEVGSERVFVRSHARNQWEVVDFLNFSLFACQTDCLFVSRFHRFPFFDLVFLCSAVHFFSCVFDLCVPNGV